jgi:tRNA 5-methylaminomethyl-2-thiouridine biosynthesis bifunctional protein
VSPDYLPMIGPVPDTVAFRERFSALRRDARKTIRASGVFEEGLFVHTALGSRGLSYAALGAEVLASRLFGEPAPVTRELARAVAPARFVIRDLIRNAS